MAQRRARLITGLLLSIAFPIMAGNSPRPSISSPNTIDRQYFAATGQYVEGKFLNYWLGHGGLPIFGYPLTPAFPEGGYLVQYFERSRFELHPENAGSPYEILLGQLGKERLKSDHLTIPKPSATPVVPGETFFPETGHKVGGAFLQYWQSHGGLFQFGYPLSPELQDMQSGLTVQYFERARFEMHPENAGTDYLVLLTLLGRERAATLDPHPTRPLGKSRRGWQDDRSRLWYGEGLR